jgi:hypothetical protein
MSMASPLSFPTAAPEGYPSLTTEPVFDPGKHLALEKPEQVISLDQLGYTQAEIDTCPTSLGVTSCFRILSPEGVACFQEVAKGLEPYAKSIERIPRMVRGGAYQSKFLRDLCMSVDVTDFLSGICDLPLLPHTIPHQLGHLNYNPTTLGQNIDKWHVDTLRIDYVLFVTDQNLVKGGEFQYFQGTKHQMADLVAAGQSLPAKRIITPSVPGAGYAVLQQGNMVVHRATGLEEIGRRITMVNGYVNRDVDVPDYTRFDQLYLADPKHVSTSEFARHVAWLGSEKLKAQIDRTGYSEDREKYAQELDAIGRVLCNAATEIRNAGADKMAHFGDG